MVSPGAIRHAKQAAVAAVAAAVAAVSPPFAAAAYAPAPPAGTVITGAARLADGDTLDLTAADGATYRVRLWGVDAPEKKQACACGGVDYACGAAATEGLRRALGDLGAVTCTVKTAPDRYGRAVAACAGPSGRDAGRALVRRGLAIELPRYSRGAYAADQRRARAARAGVWGGPFLDPAEWRREQKVADLQAAAERAAAAVPAGAPRPTARPAPAD